MLDAAAKEIGGGGVADRPVIPTALDPGR